MIGGAIAIAFVFGVYLRRFAQCDCTQILSSFRPQDRSASGMNSNRRRHPNKEIDAAVRFAIAKGWEVKPSSGHLWGKLFCPERSSLGHIEFVYGTPKGKENVAKTIIRSVSSCEHKAEGKIE